MFHGVMAAQVILVHLVPVRIGVEQHRRNQTKTQCPALSREAGFVFAQQQPLEYS